MKYADAWDDLKDWLEDKESFADEIDPTDVLDMIEALENEYE